MRSTTIVTLAALLMCVACSVEPQKLPERGSYLDHPDSGVVLPPPEPVVDPVPTRIPYPVVAIRGRALRAQRIVIEEGGATLSERVLPDGSFCLDAPLEGLSSHTFVIWAQDDEGRFSERATTIEARYDPSAPTPAGSSLCDGADPSACTGTELCGNGVDDDCNGKADALDPACSDCPVDLLEPNDASSVARIEPGTYSDLWICGGDRDFHPVYANMGQEIVARVRFLETDGDLDARLVDVAHDRVLVEATSTTDNETLRYTVTQNGTYAIEVYGVDGASAPYTLELDVR